MSLTPPVISMTVRGPATGTIYTAEFRAAVGQWYAVKRCDASFESYDANDQTCQAKVWADPATCVAITQDARLTVLECGDIPALKYAMLAALASWEESWTIVIGNVAYRANSEARGNFTQQEAAVAKGAKPWLFDVYGNEVTFDSVEAFNETMTAYVNAVQPMTRELIRKQVAVARAASAADIDAIDLGG